MSKERSIQDIVNTISQPDVHCVISNEIPKNTEECYPHILYSLVNIVKQCITKKLYTPYIHIKSNKGQLLFNDHLSIKEVFLNQIAIANPGFCEIHFIKNNDALTVYYCATTPDSLANNHKFYLDKINFTNGILDDKAYDKAMKAVLKIVKQGEGIPTDTPIDTSVTIHNYAPKLKQWYIESFRKTHA